MAAKHRQGKTLQVKDFQLELGTNIAESHTIEKHWNLHIPGFSDDYKGFRRAPLHTTHTARQAIVAKAQRDEMVRERSQTRLLNGKPVSQLDQESPVNPSLEEEEEDQSIEELEGLLE